MRQARDTAVRILQKIQGGNATLDRVIEATEPHLRQMTRSDRALVHALVYGVLRWQGRLDWMIDHLAVKSPKKIDPLIRIILRIGVYQILYMDRIPPSAAVNTCVELTKDFKKKWASGFVNGLLRSLIRQERQIPWPAPNGDPAAHLAVQQAFPIWLISRWIHRWGLEDTEELCRHINEIPAITLRTNTLKISRTELMEQIGGYAKTVEAAVHAREGIHVASLNEPLVQWPAFRRGQFQVQSEAAQLIGHLLAPRPGQNVWDACAGLGTKSAHLAQIMENRGTILASDLRTDKLGKMDKEMQRLGIGIVTIRHLDLSDPPSDLAPRSFDRILVDAPCSGLGVLQRNPDGKWRLGPGDIQHNGQRQLSLLTMAARYLKPDGTLVYAVCSLEPEENEAVVAHFLQKHPEFGIYRPETKPSRDFSKLLTKKGCLRTTPHRHGMDGFFAAAFKRITF